MSAYKYIIHVIYNINYNKMMFKLANFNSNSIPCLFLYLMLVYYYYSNFVSAQLFFLYHLKM